MLNWNEIEKYDDLINVLRNDGVVLASSDTVLGLFSQLSEKSKQQLDSIKIRNLKPYIVLVPSKDFLLQYVDQNIHSSMQKIIDTYWPGPLTIIFKAKSQLPDWLKGSDGTIAIRIPQHAGLQKILESVGGLFTTSANISGESLPVQYSQINPIILSQVQAVCCSTTEIYDGPASTILDFSSGSIQIVRQGIVFVDSM